MQYLPNGDAWVGATVSCAADAKAKEERQTQNCKKVLDKK